MTKVLILICISICILLSVICFYAPGYRFSGLIFLGFALIIACYFGLHQLQAQQKILAKLLQTILSTLLCVGLLASALTLVYIEKDAGGDDVPTGEYLLVLGAGVNGTQPSLILKSRIDAAIKYLQDHPNVICVVSGGQGAGEEISEAECMYQYITSAGIDPARIWKEDCSTSTRENFIFSLALITEKSGKRPTSLTVLSNEFHLYRAKLTAEKCGITAYGVAAETPYLSLRLNYTLREIGGVWYYSLFGGT